MDKYFLLALVFGLLLGCQERKEPVVETKTEKTALNSEQWARPEKIKPEALEILDSWPEYLALESSFSALYSVKNRDDLSVVLEDLIEKQKLLEQSVYPEAFDKPQIKSRLRVFKTYFLKVKGQMHYDLDVEESITELVTSHNALRDQFNIMVSSKLDKRLLELTEEAEDTLMDQGKLPEPNQ